MSAAMRLSRRLTVALMAVALAAAPALGAQQLAARVSEPATRITVGDPVRVELRATLPPLAVPLDSVPVTRDTLPEGVRVLQRGSWEGRGSLRSAMVVLAFFRPGTTSTPAFAMAYRRPGAAPDTVRAAPLGVVISATLPENAASMKDIKDLLPRPGSLAGRIALAAVMALALLAALAWRRARRRSTGADARSSEQPAAAASPYVVALARLDDIAGRAWRTEGDAARHYQDAADVLRSYLEEAAGVAALRRTTPEIAWALPPILAADGLRDEAARLLDAADVVKFARLRPLQAQGAAFLNDVRALLGAWHEREAVATEEVAGAIR